MWTRTHGIFYADGPQRALILAVFVNRIGKGLFNNSLVIYITLIVRLPAADVGVGVTVAGLVGLLANIPSGDLADRRGPRAIVLASLLAQTAAAGAFVFVRDVRAFFLFALVDRLTAATNGAAMGALISQVGGEQSAAFRARLRVFANLGVVAGTLGSAVAAESGTHGAYAALFLASAVSLAICALLILRVPDHAPRRGGQERRYWAAFTDRPFASFVALASGMGLHYQVVTVLLPIWISTRTDAPRWTVAACFAVNSGVCVLLQSRIGATVRTLGQGGRAFRNAGRYFLVSCLLSACAADLPTFAATALLLGAIAVHSIGEVFESSATFVLAFGLAPDDAQGRYQALFGLGFDTGQAVAPAFLTAVCGTLGQAGWALIGGLLAGIGAVGPPLARRAEQSLASQRT